MWREHLKAYRDRMGFRQEDLATILGVSTATVIDYERPKSKSQTQPPFDRAAESVRRMLVSMDWVAGVTPHMWAHDLLTPVRAHLRARITQDRVQLESVGLDRRICTLIRWTHEFEPERFNALLLSGVARLVDGKRITAERREQAMEFIIAILGGANPNLMNHTPDYLADFWQLSSEWLLNKQGEPFILDVTPHLSSIQLLVEKGLTHDFLAHHINVLTTLNEAWQQKAEATLAEE